MLALRVLSQRVLFFRFHSQIVVQLKQLTLYLPDLLLFHYRLFPELFLDLHLHPIVHHLIAIAVAIVLLHLFHVLAALCFVRGLLFNLSFLLLQLLVVRGHLLPPRLGNCLEVPLVRRVLLFFLLLQIGLRRMMLLSQLEGLLALLKLVFHLALCLLHFRLLNACAYLVRGGRFDIALHPDNIFCRILHFGVEFCCIDVTESAH